MTVATNGVPQTKLKIGFLEKPGGEVVKLALQEAQESLRKRIFEEPLPNEFELSEVIPAKGLNPLPLELLEPLRSDHLAVFWVADPKGQEQSDRQIRDFIGSSPWRSVCVVHQLASSCRTDRLLMDVDAQLGDWRRRIPLSRRDEQRQVLHVFIPGNSSVELSPCLEWWLQNLSPDRFPHIVHMWGSEDRPGLMHEISSCLGKNHFNITRIIAAGGSVFYSTYIECKRKEPGLPYDNSRTDEIYLDRLIADVLEHQQQGERKKDWDVKVKIGNLVRSGFTMKFAAVPKNEPGALATVAKGFFDVEGFGINIDLMTLGQVEEDTEPKIEFDLTYWHRVDMPNSLVEDLYNAVMAKIKAETERRKLKCEFIPMGRRRAVETAEEESSPKLHATEYGDLAPFFRPFDHPLALGRIKSPPKHATVRLGS